MPGLKIAEQDRQTIPAKFFCTLCSFLMIQPVQTVCGHLFCSECVEDLEKKRCAVCPLDGQVIDKNKIFHDNFTKREIMDIKIHCLNEGCPWFDVVRNYQEHADSCHEAQISCSNELCDETVKRSLLDHHLNSECLYRQENCPRCQTVMTVFTLQNAHEDCPAFPTTCTHCGRTDIAQCMMDYHQQFECDEVTVGCEFKAVGCPYAKVGNGKELRKHSRNSISLHLHLFLRFMMDFVGSVKQELVEMISALSVQVFEKLASITSQVVALTETARGLESRVVDLESGVGVGASHGFEALQKNIQGLVKRNEILSKQNEDFRTELNQKTALLQRLQVQVSHLDDSMALTTVKLSDMDQGGAAGEIPASMSSVNGTLLWKIDEFARKRQEAVNGNMAAIYSPHFYSSQFGYKMCVRIYMNGDGFGKGTHISLFFVVMRSDYDALLPWPFQKKITMMILDQVNGDHMIDAFRSDPDSSSFQRPHNKMNIASGSPLFLPLDGLKNRGYVRDDVMFVKVIVD